ncbi:MAG: hypothetical protein WCH34_17100 [Bacteroidota bacterium]
MELSVKGTFYRDISAYTNRALLKTVLEVMHEIEKADSIAKINNIKKLRKYKNQYRIKLLEGYRIGLIVKKDKVCLVRFGHRNAFYKYFP